jgi:short-subunit dehydrogenase
VGLLLVSAPSLRKEKKMKKGEKKVIKNKNEVVIAEKVIDTKKKTMTSKEMSNEIKGIKKDIKELIGNVGFAFKASDDNFKTIEKKVNQICVRMGLTKIK